MTETGIHNVMNGDFGGGVTRGGGRDRSKEVGGDSREAEAY